MKLFLHAPATSVIRLILLVPSSSSRTEYFTALLGLRLHRRLCRFNRPH
jgi:hypothetical protein